VEAAQPAAPEAAVGLAVRFATGGQTLPEFGLPPSPAGNWMVVVVDLANEGAEPVDVPLQAFSLRTSEGVAPLDPSADLAATIAGVTPAWAAGDTISLQPGEATRALLLFQVDPAANGMTLVGPGVEAPIGDALSAGGSIAMLPAAPSVP